MGLCTAAMQFSGICRACIRPSRKIGASSTGAAQHCMSIRAPRTVFSIRSWSLVVTHVEVVVGVCTLQEHVLPAIPDARRRAKERR